MAFVGNTPSAVPLTGSQIADGTIVNANIATNTINLTQKVTSALAAANGGTGVSTYTAGNILYASNTTTLTTLAPGTSGYALTLNGTTPTWAAVGASAGQVIQVLSATDSTQRSTTSTTFVTGSNTMSVSITPSNSSSKFIIMAAVASAADYNAFVALGRNGTILEGSASGLGGGGATTNIPVTPVWYDSPTTSSAITYQVYLRVDGGTGYINNRSTTGSIIVMEIKG